MSDAFNLLSESDRQRIFDASTPTRYEDGATIIEEGQLSDSLYLLETGDAYVERTTVGQLFRIGALSDGDIFGEMSFLEQRPAVAAVVADGNVSVRSIASSEIVRELEADPQLASRFYRSLANTLSRRLRELEDRFVGIDCFRNAEFRDDASLKNEMLEMLAPSYQDPTAILERELAHCNRGYLYRENGRLAFFFLTAWEEFHADANSSLPATYMGLTAARQDLKNSGAVRAVYTSTALDEADWQRQHQIQRVVWATTATPSSYFAAELFTSDVNPKRDGSYSYDSLQIANLIRRTHGFPPPASGDHPFVLRNVAPDTLYSDTERARIRHVSQRKEFTLLEDLGVDEQRHDRLLFVGRVPRV